MMFRRQLISNSFVTPRTVAPQAPLSRGFSRQEYWSRLSFLPPGDLADPGIKPEFPMLEGWFFATEPPGKPHKNTTRYILCPELIKETEPLDLSNSLTKSEVDMASEPEQCSSAWEPQLLKSMCLGPVLPNKKSPQTMTRESLCAAVKTQCSQK